MTISLAPRDRWNAAGAEIRNPKGVNVHRMAGRISPHYTVLEDPARFPTLWHWTVDNRTGHLWVHAPWWVRGQHSNGGNVWGPAVETDGFIEEPVSPLAVATLQRLFRDFGETVGFEIRRDLGTIKEHREWGTTTCPGDSYQTLYAAMAPVVEEPMTPEEKTAFDALKNEHDWLLRMVVKNTDRMKQLEEDERASLEERATRFESNTGPIGLRLKSLEDKSAATTDAVTANAHLLDTHLNNHPSGLSRDHVIDAFEAGVASLNGEKP
jgi:hypothetical protein